MVYMEIETISNGLMVCNGLMVTLQYTAKLEIQTHNHHQCCGVQAGFGVGRGRQFRLQTESKLDSGSVGVGSFC